MSRSRSRSRRHQRSRSRSLSSRSRRGRRDSYSSYSSRSDDYSDSFSSDERSSYRNSRKSGGKGQSNKHGTAAKSKKPNGRNSKSQKSPRAGITDTVTKRMLSARRNRINELRNQSEELTILVNELKLENKSLKRQQKLQDKALEKYEGQENDMSSILDHHSKEINAAKEQTKRYRDKLQKTDKKLKDTDFELDRTKKLVKKLKDLVDDRQLQERDDLSKKLSKAEAELDKKSQRLLDLERHLEHLKKNHRHEVGIERAREKDAQRQLDVMREENERLKSCLKEKEKELEVANIYRYRALKPPHRLNSSVRSSPVPNGLPRSRQRKNSDSSILTPRDRAKQYEKQRHQKKLRPVGRNLASHAVAEDPPQQNRPMVQSPSQSPPHQNHHSSRMQFSFTSHKSNQYSHDNSSRESDSRLTGTSPAHSPERQVRPEQEYKPPFHPKPPSKPIASPIASKDTSFRSPQRIRTRTPSPQLLTLTDKPTEEVSKPVEPSPKSQPAEKRTNSPVLLHINEQSPKQKSPFNNRQPVKDIPQQETSIFTTEVSNSPDSPLPWMKPKKEPDPIPSQQTTEDEETRRRKKEQLLSKLKAIDEQKSGAEQKTAKYSVNKPVENMHHGLPAYENVTVPILERDKRRKSLASDSDSDAGYKPSFMGNSKTQNSHGAKSGPKNKSKKTDNDVSWLTGGASDGSKTNGFSATDREVSSAALAGGTALFDDDAPPQSNRHLLPRRQRQTAQILSSKPSYNAVDVVDDDLEEVLI